MVVEPPGAQYPPPPPVADRRAPERRSYERRAEDRAQFARTAAAAALAISGGLVVVFVFFWALGAIDIKHAAALTIAVCVLAIVWLAGFLFRHRQAEAENVVRRERERRGF